MCGCGSRGSSRRGGRCGSMTRTAGFEVPAPSNLPVPVAAPPPPEAAAVRPAYSLVDRARLLIGYDTAHVMLVLTREWRKRL